MHILSNQLLKKLLRVTELPVVYYFKEELCVQNLENFSKTAKGEYKKIDEMNATLPFNTQVIICGFTETTREGVEDAIVICLINKIVRKKIGIIYSPARNEYIFFDMVAKNNRNVFERVSGIVTGALISLTSHKETIINLCQGRALTPKKGKYKKQNFLYITDKKYKSSYDTPGVKYVDSMYAFDVCGHWREYKNPGIKGRTPRGEVIMGKTWVTPYTKGVGKEKFNKIRIFLK